MNFQEVLDKILASEPDPSPEMLEAAEVVVKRMLERKPDEHRAWAESVAQWVVETDFGEYE